MIKPHRPRRKTTSNPPDERSGLRYALRLLKSRPRTSFEVVSRLRERDYSDVVANSVAGQLLEVGLLDDRRFARDWVRYRDRLRPSGEWLLRHELSEKGLDKRLIDQTLVDRQTPEWFEEVGLVWDGRPIDRHLCEQLASRRSRRQDGLTDPEAFRRRLGQLLARRGFAPVHVLAVIRLPQE